MIRAIFIFLLGVSTARGADTEQIRLNPRSLVDLPNKRHATLTLLVITGSDSTPAISEKKAKYIETLKALLRDLHDTFYWRSEFPKDMDAAIEKRAIYLAGLHYPASSTTGASYYRNLVQSYVVEMYEEQIVTIAHAVTERFKEKDVAVVGGELPSFTMWLDAWNKAGAVKNGPNQLPASMSRQNPDLDSR